MAVRVTWDIFASEEGGRVFALNSRIQSNERARSFEFLSIFFFSYDTSGYINSVVNSPSFPLVVKRRRRILFASMFFERASWALVRYTSDSYALRNRNRGSGVTSESCRIGVRNDLMLGEWRSWEIGTANTAKRREIVERSPGRRGKVGLVGWGEPAGERGRTVYTGGEG